MLRFGLLGFVLLMAAVSGAGAATTAPADAKASFVNIKDGDHVKSPFKVEFAVTGLEVAPAGTDKPNTGHFHLLIDAPPPAASSGAMGSMSMAGPSPAIPNDEHHLHFGKGQTEATVTLPPGKHTLQLLMGDGSHHVHDHPVMSDPITIYVDQE